MLISPSKLQPGRSYRPFLMVLILSLTAAAQEWRPVSPEELAMTEPKVEKDADAEAIFWETKLDDRRSSRLTISHYVRLKIFTERGRERFSKVEIPFMRGKRVEDVAARVIRPDGSIVNLNQSDIFEQEVARVGRARYMAKSFAVPGIEPGVIVEYQYTESIRDDSVAGERLLYQRDIPLQRVTFWIRPFRNASLRYNWYNLPEGRFRDDPNMKGYQVSTMYDVPAHKEEPFMPPDDEVRRWAYVTYNTWGNLLIWNLVATGLDGLHKQSTRPSRDIRQKAAELTARAATDEEKLRNLYDFCQRGIRNISFDRNLDEEQRGRIRIRDANDVLRQKMGTSMFINLLFASLARALDFETTLVLAGDKSETFFNPDKYPFASFVDPSGVAVRKGNEWLFFNPGIPYLGYNQIPWNREGVRSMLVGDGGFLWTTSPMTDHEKSSARRTGRFKLLGDGTLEGTVKIEYEGHQAIERRRDGYRDSQTKREDDLRDLIRSRLSTAELSAISILHFDDPSQPLTYEYRIKVPNYAQRAGRRLLLQPNVFEFGAKPVFSSDTREYNIFFPYALSTTDDIRIELPQGFDLESADSPAGVADPERVGSLTISMSVERPTNVLVYKRNYHFGRGGLTLFPVAAYPAVKQLFDSFNVANSHQLSLAQAREQ